MLFAGLLGTRRVVGMGGVFCRVLRMDTFVMGVFFMSYIIATAAASLDAAEDGHGVIRRRRFARGLAVIVLAMCMVVIMAARDRGRDHANDHDRA